MSLFENSRTRCRVCTLKIGYSGSEDIGIYQENYVYQCNVLSETFKTLEEIKLAIAEYLQQKAIKYLNISEKIREEIK